MSIIKLGQGIAIEENDSILFDDSGRDMMEELREALEPVLIEYWKRNEEICNEMEANGVEFKIFVADDGTRFRVPARTCPLCKHCVDVLYNAFGPCAYACDTSTASEEQVIGKGLHGKCELFVEK